MNEKIWRRGRRGLFGIAAVAVAASLIAAAPATADDGFGDRIEAILSALPTEHQVFADAAAGKADVPLDPAAGVGVVSSEGQSLRVGLPSAGSGDRGTPLRAGAVAHDNGDGSTTVPIPKTDGSVQIVNVIETATAPEAYRFTLDLPAGAVAQQGENGAVAIVSEKGTLVAGVSAPWAVDAVGTAVPTRYEFDGTTLTQIVDHAAGDFAYPVVADPWLGIDLYGSPSVSFPSGGYAINVTPTAWGGSFSGVGNVGMWWAHRDEVVSKLGSSSWRWTTSIQEQFYCHIAGFPLGLPQYNMESWRPLVYWESSLAFYQCNP